MIKGIMDGRKREVDRVVYRRKEVDKMAVNFNQQQSHGPPEYNTLNIENQMTAKSNPFEVAETDRPTST